MTDGLCPGSVGGRPPPSCEACSAIHRQTLQPEFGQCARWRAECERSIQALNTSSPHRWGLLCPNHLSRNVANKGGAFKTLWKVAPVRTPQRCAPPNDCHARSARRARIPHRCRVRTPRFLRSTSERSNGTRYTYNLKRKAGDRETRACKFGA